MALIDFTLYNASRFNSSEENPLGVMQVWLSFLQNFNGKTFFYTEQWDSQSSVELFSDAAGSKGYGAIFGKHWFFGAWPDTWKHLNITFLEFFPIVIALRIWVP